MTLRRNVAHRSWLPKAVLLCLALFVNIASASAQSVVVMVNDDPITTYDVAQRERFLALTSGLGERMKARLQSEETQKAFKAYMYENQPQSREEAQELQKKFVAKIQQDVVASASGSMRKEATNQLIEERLMLQAAKDNKITITDKEVNEALTRMAQGGSRQSTLEEFLASFKSQGINPETLKQRIRAQTAWHQVIRRLYGSRVQSSVSVAELSTESAAKTIVDVEVVKLSMPANAEQKVVAHRLVEAEEIRKSFSSCAALAGQLKGRNGVSVRSVKAADINEFAGDARVALSKARAGEMTPPIITPGALEIHAVCAKKVENAPEKKEKKADAQDKIQEEFQLYARRHLKDLKDRALLRYPNSNG